MEFLKTKKSKKLIVAIVTAVAVAVNDYMGKPVSEDAILKVVGIVSIYLVGQGLSDFGKEGKKAEIEAQAEGPAWEDGEMGEQKNG